MKIGTVVKIKDGNIDPDTKMKLDGFIGRIKEFYASDFVNIEWDSKSLQVLPDSFIRSAIKCGCDYLSYNIETKDLEVCEARDKPSDVLKEVKKLGTKWDNLELYEDDAELIEEIEESGWWDYLQEHLTFPFNAVVIESTGVFKAGTVIKILELHDNDDFYGIITKGKIARKTIHFALSELEIIENKKNANMQLVHLYQEYFWNQ